MFPSEAHYHTADSPCLKEAPEVPTGEWTQVDHVAIQVTLALPDWYRCERIKDYYVHRHADRFYAHHPREKCAFAA